MHTIFQNFGIYPLYMKQLHARLGSVDHATIMQSVLYDRFVALHMLQPVLSGEGGRFVVGDDVRSQQAWAKEHRMPNDISREAVLLAQIEESRAEVFYNMDPVTFDGNFARKLPGCIKRKIAWRAAPSPGLDLGGYDLVVCNFESILQSYRERGWRAAWFYPAFDPEMANYRQTDRTVDVAFIGSYSRHHRSRAQIIEAVARLQDRHQVRIHLQQSRMTRLAASLSGLIPPLREHRLPTAIAKVAQPPVFGRTLYTAFGNAKIVVNGAIDMSGTDKGNMRCWETLGCGALMLSDDGTYPDGFVNGETMVTYKGPDDMLAQLDALLGCDRRRLEIASAGYKMLEARYSKARQWEDFVKLL